MEKAWTQDRLLAMSHLCGLNFVTCKMELISPPLEEFEETWRVRHVKDSAYFRSPVNM